MLDALSYAASVIALLGLSSAARPFGPSSPLTSSTSSPFVPGFITGLREGWAEFSSRTWLWVTSVYVCLFNFFVWAPFLVLGPVIAQRRFGGAASWGIVMALYGVGAVAGGIAMLGRRPRRPLFVATAATLGWSLPSAALATGRSLPWVCAAALAAGVGSAVGGTLYAATTQAEVPLGTLARVSAYDAFGAFALGPVGLAAAGPVSVLVGTSGVLGFGALWQLAAAAVVLTLPAIRVPFARHS